MKKHVIIVAGGSGTRIKSSKPKQFLEIGNQPILFHTLERFFQYDKNISIILVLPLNQIPLWNSITKKAGFDIPHNIIEGGPTRFHSVKNGLSITKEKGLIAIHDGVRPFVNNTFLDSVFNRAEKKGNCIPILPVDQSLRYVNGSEHKIADRNYYYFVQTPQCFHAEIIHHAYQQEYHPRFTDDASVVEAIGEKIHLINGLQENIKITRPIDIQLAEAILFSQKNK